MPEVIGFVKGSKSYKNRTICPHCDAIIEFWETEIITYSWGHCIHCPNCHKDIKL